MKISKKIKYFKTSSIKQLIFLLFPLSFIASLNVNPSSFFNEGNNFIQIVNLIRFILPLFITVYFFFLIKKKIFKNFNYHFIKIFLIKNKIIFITLIYILYMGFLDVINYNDTVNNNEFSKIHYFYYYLWIVFIFYLILGIIYYKKTFILHFKLLIIILFCISIIFILFEILANKNYAVDLRSALIFNEESFIFNNRAPRTTGIARYILIFYILYLCHYFNKPNYFLLFFLNFIILSLASRTSYYFLLFFNLILMFRYDLTILKKIIVIITLSISPYLFTYIITNIEFSENKYNSKMHKEKNKEKNKIEDLKNKDFNEKKINNFNEKKINNFNEKKINNFNEKKINNFNEKIFNNFNSPSKRVITKLNTDGKFFTGRDLLWSEVINMPLRKQVLGNGMQSDRKLLKTSVSNGFFYSLLSAGVVGVIYYICITLIVLKYCLINLINNKLYISRIHPSTLAAIFVSFFLVLRSFVETSYSFYGADFILLYISTINLITQSKIKIKH